MGTILYQLVLFLFFLIPLIFVHELGHYLVARLVGVRVLAFSLGFGPVLFSFKPRHTVFKFSLIPLGGYVKMLGDEQLSSDTEQSAPSEQLLAMGYRYKSPWKRFLIVLAGPVANFIFSIFLYLALLSYGESVKLFEIGIIAKDSIKKSYALQSGDYIFKINNRVIAGPEDLALTGPSINNIMLLRNGGKIELSPAQPIDSMIWIKQILEEYQPNRKFVYVSADDGLEYQLYYFRDDHPQKNIITEYAQMDLLDFSSNLVFYLEPLKSELVKKQAILIGAADSFLKLNQIISDRKIYLKEMRVAAVVKGSIADSQGIIAGDYILKINNIFLTNFFSIKKLLNNKSIELGAGLEVEYYKAADKKIITSSFIVTKNFFDATTRLLGVQTDIEPVLPKLTKTEPMPIGLKLLDHGIDRFLYSCQSVFQGIVTLFTTSRSFEMVSGPFTLAKVASHSFEIGIDHFLRLMALISINLGLVNLLPIPVLDGGHLVFISYEMIFKKPMSEWIMGIGVRLGLLFILLLMTLALFNDLFR